MLVLAAACGDVEPGDPYVTTAPMTATSGGTGSSTAEASTSTTGSETTTSTAADSTGSDSGGCSPGTEGCPCSDDVCDPGLTCLSEICVDAGPVCPIGTVGCPCTQGGTCDPGLACVSMTCVAD